MAHFAKINALGIVENVIAADQDFIDLLPDKTSWVRATHDTCDEDHPEDTPCKKNCVGIGYSYDVQRNAFIPPKPFNSWVLDESTCLWGAPSSCPTDGKMYAWDESKLSWVEPDPVTGDKI